VGPGGRVVDAAVPGQLIRLLAVLAPALAVALTGDAAVAGARPARQPEGQGQVDPGRDRVGALAVLLGPASREQDDVGPGQPLGDGAQVGYRYAGEPLDPLRPVPGHAPRDVEVARRSIVHIGPVDPALGDDQV